MNTLADVVSLLSNFEILDLNAQPFFIKNSQGVYCYCNESFVEQIGIPKNRILGSTAFDLFPISNAMVYTAADRELFDAASSKQEYIGPISLIKGQANAVTFKKNLIFSEQGEAIGFLGTFLVNPTERLTKWPLGLNSLTYKEQTVLDYIAQGYSNKKIANQLNISEHTVSSHMKAIYSKLDVHSKTEAVYKALIQLNITKS